MDKGEHAADPVEQLFSGRRSFDRQMEMLTIAVHTLQRDFATLDERVRGIRESVTGLAQALEDLEREVHKLDRALVARLATITVTERVLWAIATVLIGVGAKIFG